MTDSKHLLVQLQALANPVRLWIVAQLHRNKAQYVSELARAAGISRPLLKMHLRKLEEAGLVTSAMGTAENGKAANFFEIVPFDMQLTPETITRFDPAPTSLTNRKDGDDYI